MLAQKKGFNCTLLNSRLKLFYENFSFLVIAFRFLLSLQLIISHLPENMEPFDHTFKKGTGLCSHPALLDTNWLKFNGQKAFSTAELPNEFYCVGIQNRGTSEYLFVLWVKEGRKFWFYDRYVVFIGPGFPDSPERTSERLNEALVEYNHEEKDNTSGNG